MITRTVMILPTLACNQNCPYCYVTYKDNIKIEISTIEQIYKKTKDYLSSHEKEKIIFLWHGGEPTLMSENSWRKYFDYQNILSTYTISNSIQTNLNCNRNIIDYFLFKKNNISSSLDGDFQIHSQTRNSNHNNYLNLIENIRYVRENQKSFGVICVVSKYQIETDVGKLLSFYENLGVNVSFNMVSKGDWENNITYSEYFNFLKEIASYWLNDRNSKINVDPISTDITVLLGDRSRTSCNRNFDCFTRFIAIDNMGDCYPCTRFVGDKTWLLGNIENFSLEKYWNETAIKLLESMNYRKRCISCEYIKICGCGCKGEQKNNSEKDFFDYCESFKQYINFLKSILEQKINIARIEETDQLINNPKAISHRKNV